MGGVSQMLTFVYMVGGWVVYGNESDAGVSRFQKILRNQQGGSSKNLMFTYKVVGWVKKSQKYAYVISI